MIVAKQCWDCKEVKSLGEFGVSRRNEDGLNSMCKACNARRAKKIRDAKPKAEREVKTTCDFPDCGRAHSSRGYCVTHANQHRAGKILTPISLPGVSEGNSHQESRRKREARNRERVHSIKVDTGCVDCGYNSHPHALEFDHLPEFDKDNNVSSMMARSWTNIQEEIAKCEVVCANCHRIRTANRRKGEASE